VGQLQVEAHGDDLRRRQAEVSFHRSDLENDVAIGRNSRGATPLARGAARAIVPAHIDTRIRAILSHSVIGTNASLA
jgi:hypothetical protein